MTNNETARKRHCSRRDVLGTDEYADVAVGADGTILEISSNVATDWRSSVLGRTAGNSVCKRF
jgi:hypothetical protein